MKPDDATPIPTTTRLPDEPKTRPRQSRVLVSDKNRHVRELLRRELNKDNFQVEIATSREEIRRLLLSGHAIDVLILDPDLPGMKLETMIGPNNKDLLVILHTSDAPDLTPDILPVDYIRVEKAENSVDTIREIIRVSL